MTHLRQGFGGQAGGPGALVLFDIDGTLLLSGGAGVRSMALAFADVFGVANAFDGIPVAGRTDTYLVSRALQRAGIADTSSTHEQFRLRYLEILPDEIKKPGSGRKGLMPGVDQLLDEVGRRDWVFPALLTGNYQPAAQLKLAYFGVASFFEWGAFGEESADRGELARLALGRAEDHAVPDAARENVVVIGDTPHDVECARVIGARVIAVATGGYSEEDLRASGADYVVGDLRDTVTLLQYIARQS